MSKHVDLLVSKVITQLFEVVGEVREVISLRCPERGSAAASVIVEHQRELVFERGEITSQRLMSTEWSAMTHVDRPTSSHAPESNRHLVRCLELQTVIQMVGSSATRSRILPDRGRHGERGSAAMALFDAVDRDVAASGEQEVPRSQQCRAAGSTRENHDLARRH